jgi:hypothetical protein
MDLLIELLSVRFFVWRDNFISKPINNSITDEIEIINNMIYKIFFHPLFYRELYF